MADTRKIGTN